MVDVEQLLHRQRQQIQDEFHVQYGFDPLEPHFVNELRAFYNRPQRWNTQIRFGPLAMDTSYRQRQHQQDGPPPPQPTMQSFMEAVQHDMLTVNQESPLPTHAVHAEPPPPQTTTSDNQNQPLHPLIHEHTPSAPTQTRWQPPENSNLQWVWLDGDGPFLTNATLGHSPVRDNLPGFNFEINFKTTGLANEANALSTTLVAQVAVHVNLATTPDDSLHHRMHDVGFRFKVGDSSRPPQSSLEDEALELHLAQFHIETTDTMPWFNPHTTINDQHVPRPNNPKLLLHKPNNPGPPFQNLLTTNPPPMHITHTSWLIPHASSPQAHANLNSLDSPLLPTQHSPLSPVNPPPLLSLPDIPHSTTTTTRK
jgi:hypothetical protein